MGTAFWITRFVVSLGVAFGILFGVELLKGAAHPAALRFAGLWGFISAAIFTLTGYMRYRRNPTCMTTDRKR